MPRSGGTYKARNSRWEPYDYSAIEHVDNQPPPLMAPDEPPEKLIRALYPTVAQMARWAAEDAARLVDLLYA